jgi:YidC/Oxa1 family membrane protein insertase
MHALLAASWLDPIVNLLYGIVTAIDKPVGNLGWSLVILAGLIRLLFWPLNTAQFKAFLNMQKIAPMLKRVQERYKDDKAKQQQETMALYKEQGVNPFAGCWPLLVQYPVIISVFYVVQNNKKDFANQGWLWVGSAFAHAHTALVSTAGAVAQAHATTFSHCIGWCFFDRPILGLSLATPDTILILAYALSMYLSVRYVSMPATDPQQAQTQRMMAVLSPVMLGFFGWKYQWPSAMVLYWCSYNIFTMGQQFYLLRRYHQPLSLVDSEHAITADVPQAKSSPNGQPASQRPKTARSKRKNKRGN